MQNGLRGHELAYRQIRCSQIAVEAESYRLGSSHQLDVRVQRLNCLVIPLYVALKLLNLIWYDVKLYLPGRLVNKIFST